MNLAPIVLFVYSRPDHTRQTVAALQKNYLANESELFIYSDGPKNERDAPKVQEVREYIHSVDGFKNVNIIERGNNLGLGRSILTGVTEVLAKHEAAIIFEDDLICVPGTYAYLCAALEKYQDDDRVISVTGWTHPLVTPNDVTNLPYFDGRAECWVWGTWNRAWHGMDIDAKTLMEQCKDQGIDIYRYGADLVDMAKAELLKNIWAVRFLYWHILNRGLCLRPPWSMVEHIGFDANATNESNESWLINTPLKPSPTIPVRWPLPVENAECARLHQKVFGTRPTVTGLLYRFASSVASRALRAVYVK